MFILDMYHTSHFREHVMTVLPQKSFNSYDSPSTDILGTPGLWSSGAQRGAWAGRTRAVARAYDVLASFTPHL